MGSRPGEGSPVPGLPEDWGRIVVPDDASELAGLAEEVRLELGTGEEEYALPQQRLPFIVVAVTLAIALVSLFTVPWLGRVGQVTPPKTSISTTVESSWESGCGDRTTRCPTPSGSASSAVTAGSSE